MVVNEEKIVNAISNYLYKTGDTSLIYIYVYDIAERAIKRKFDNLDKYDLYVEDIKGDILEKIINNIDKVQQSKNKFNYIYSSSLNYVRDKIRRHDVNEKRKERYWSYSYVMYDRWLITDEE